MMRLGHCCMLTLLVLHVGSVSAWTTCHRNLNSHRSGLTMAKQERDIVVDFASSSSACRRQFLGSTLGGAMLIASKSPAAAVERAVGSAEKDCREAGNCLEKGEWDGAVGWSWGGKDRCDATDPRCGVDGQLMDAPPTGDPVPPTAGIVTHEVQILLSIGRGETGTLRLGLYGQDCPATVEQAVNFLSSKGIVTTSRLVFENGIGVSSAPVSLINGGILNAIVPQQRLDFGIPSQAAAFARSRGRAKPGDDFVPQPRPKSISDEPSMHSHDMAGLVSVPSKGIGYGGSGRESEDEAFASAFEITAGPAPSMDKEGRRVIGQVLDDASMAVVARLATLPTKKGIKGVIPGQNSGPPLLKVAVQDIAVKAV